MGLIFLFEILKRNFPLYRCKGLAKLNTVKSYKNLGVETLQMFLGGECDVVSKYGF